MIGPIARFTAPARNDRPAPTPSSPYTVTRARRPRMPKLSRCDFWFSATTRPAAASNSTISMIACTPNRSRPGSPC